MKIIIIAFILVTFVPAFAEDFYRGPIDPTVPFAAIELVNRVEPVSEHHVDNLIAFENFILTSESLKLFVFNLLSSQIVSGESFLHSYMSKQLQLRDTKIDSIRGIQESLEMFVNTPGNEFSLSNSTLLDQIKMLEGTVVLRSSFPSLISLAYLSPKEIDFLVKLMSDMNHNPKKYSNALSGKTGGVFLLKPSTRTRTSSERALYNLGANVIALSSETSQVKKGEPLSHTFLALSSSVDVIFFRGYDHKEFEINANQSRVPLINSLTNDHHPLQALADTWTLINNFGMEGVRNKNFVFIGDGKSNEVRSLMFILPQYGINLIIATPNREEFKTDNNDLKSARERIQRYNFKGFTKTTHDISYALSLADFVYTDSFRLMESDEDRNRRRVKTLLELGFQINDELLGKLKPGTKIMHAMPIHEGEEVHSRSIVEGHYSLMPYQADARVLSAMAVLNWTFKSYRQDISLIPNRCVNVFRWLY